MEEDFSFVGGLTEDQIECRVESKFNRLDHVFMAGFFGQEEYDRLAKGIATWADREYRFRLRS